MTSNPSQTCPRILIIAGSDSGGGAGIQADIKTVTALGGYAMTAVTAITAQDTTGVHGVWPVPTDIVTRQIRVVLGDIGADVVKTGMLATRALIEAVADTLAETVPDLKRVLDPVMVATSGDRLIDESAVGAMTSVMIPGAALVTPNAPEAEVLTGKAVESVDGQRRAAEALLEAGALGALVKGGHVAGDEITDVLQTHHGEWLFASPRISSRNTHGTGCTLASACATGVAQGMAVNDAVDAARQYVRKAISTAPRFGQGQGPLNHAWPVQKSE